MAKVACSVIVVSYYTNESLFECLASLFAEQNDAFQLDIVVVDNGNPKRHSKRLAAFSEAGDIQWLHGQGNIGFAAGCNLGVQHAKADTVLLLNPDCIPQQGAVQNLCHFLHQQPEKTVVSGWVTNTDGSEQRGLRRNLLTPWSLCLEMLPIINQLPRLRQKRLNLTAEPIEGDILDIAACSGACMMVQKALYNDLDGMDEQYFLHVDDLDFCRRLIDDGGRVRIDTRCVFAHYQGTSVVSGKRVALYKRNSFNYYFMQHHAVFWRSPLGWGLRLAIELNYRLSKKT